MEPLSWGGGEPARGLAGEERHGVDRAERKTGGVRSAPVRARRCLRVGVVAQHADTEEEVKKRLKLHAELQKIFKSTLLLDGHVDYGLIVCIRNGYIYSIHDDYISPL